MKKSALMAALLAAVASGCALYHTESDTDAVRYARAWERPGREQQPVVFIFQAQGEADESAELRREALNIFFDSGQFREATPEDEPAYIIQVTIAVHRNTHVFKTVCNALILYAWPIDAQDYFCEAFVVVRQSSGEVVERCYGQSRGRAELWLGYVFWPQWLWNDEHAGIMRRDALKAAAVKACRAIMVRAEK